MPVVFWVSDVEDSALEGLRRHLARSFNDILVLRSLIRTPLWEYRLMSRIEETYGVKGGVYPSSIPFSITWRAGSYRKAGGEEKAEDIRGH